MMKTVSFVEDAPLVHTLPTMKEEEYPLTFFSKEEIEQFRHEAVLEMMGVSSPSSTDALSPILQMSTKSRRKRLSKEANVKSDADVLAALAASPLFQQTPTEDPAKSGGNDDDDLGKDRSRPQLGERQPSVRERRASGADRRRPRQSLVGSEKVAAAPETDLADSLVSPRTVAPSGRERRQRTPAGNARPPRTGGRVIRNSVSRDRSVISALPAAPPVV